MDLTDYLPTEINISTNSTHKLLALATNNIINLRYITPVSNQTNLIVGKRIHNFKIPRNVSSNFRVLGLLQAEMSKGKNNGKIQFVNSEPEILKLVIDWFKEFGLQIRDWKWRITINKKLNYDKEMEIKIKEFWKRQTYFLDENFKGIRYSEFEGSMLKNTSIWGSVTIEAGNTILRGLIVGVLDKVFNNLVNLSDKEKLEFLDGFCSGESCINRRRIITAVKDDKKRTNIKNIMTSLNIDMDKEWPSRGAYSIVASGFSDLFKIYKYRICRTHPEKWLRVLNDLLSIQRFDRNARPLKNEFLMMKKQIQLESIEIKEYLEKRKSEFHEA